MTILNALVWVGAWTFLSLCDLVLVALYNSCYREGKACDEARIYSPCSTVVQLRWKSKLSMLLSSARDVSFLQAMQKAKTVPRAQALPRALVALMVLAMSTDSLSAQAL